MSHKADEYNSVRMAKRVIRAEHVTALTKCFQREHGLKVDGLLGPKTMRVLLQEDSLHPVLKEAAQYLGKGEYSGKRADNNTGKYVNHFRAGGSGKGLGGAGAWCAEFVSYCLNNIGSGVTPSRGAKRLVRNVAAKGKEVKVPQAGDVICWHRGAKISWQGHVEIVVSYDEETDTLVTIGGNKNNRKDKNGGYSVVDYFTRSKGAWRRRLYKIARFE